MYLKLLGAEDYVFRQSCLAVGRYRSKLTSWHKQEERWDEVEPKIAWHYCRPQVKQMTPLLEKNTRRGAVCACNPQESEVLTTSCHGCWLLLPPLEATLHQAQCPSKAGLCRWQQSWSCQAYPWACCLLKSPSKPPKDGGNPFTVFSGLCVKCCVWLDMFKRVYISAQLNNFKLLWIFKDTQLGWHKIKKVLVETNFLP